MKLNAIAPLLVTMVFGFATNALTQLVPISPPNTTLTEREKRGRALVMQSCSMCHLPQVPRPRRPYGPPLNGLLRKERGTGEEQVRDIILKGTAKMPGYQYALTSAELDDIVAFLKTF